MPYSEELKKKIEYIENEIANSKNKNVELENQLLKLKVQQMEEDLREQNNQQLLKG